MARALSPGWGTSSNLQVALRRKLLTLAREWMHAAMHQQGAKIHQESTEPMDANSGEPWSKMDLDDLKASLAFGNRIEATANMLCRDEDEVREKAKELGLEEHPGKRTPIIL